MCTKISFEKKLVLVLEMTILESSWWKHSQKPLGVNLCQIWPWHRVVTLRSVSIIKTKMEEQKHLPKPNPFFKLQYSIFSRWVLSKPIIQFFHKWFPLFPGIPEFYHIPIIPYSPTNSHPRIQRSQEVFRKRSGPIQPSKSQSTPYCLTRLLL